MKPTLNFIALLTFLVLNFQTQAQDCPILNENGHFEDIIQAPGAEPALGITVGSVTNWSASHGTVDYVTAEWDWYNNLDEVTSNAGHMCYGNREIHDHSEGIFSQVEILDDEDLIYTLSFDFASHCDDTLPGYAHFYLSNVLSAEGHNMFSFPTPENRPELFDSAQQLLKVELNKDTEIRENGFSHHEITFTANEAYSQLWIFTEYMHPYVDFVNCGFFVDNVEITAHTKSLDAIDIVQLENNEYQFKPNFTKDIEVLSNNWTLSNDESSSDEEWSSSLTDGNYTVCLDIVDSRKACASVCRNFNVGAEIQKTLCNYSICLDNGGVPTLEQINFRDANGNSIELNSAVAGFHFPYCLGSPEQCELGINELEIFASDMNSWLTSKGLIASVNLDQSNTDISDGCRGRILEIYSSELTFETALVGDQNLTEAYSLSFSQADNSCEQVNILNDEYFIAPLEYGFEEEIDQNEKELNPTAITFDFAPNPVIDILKIELNENVENAEINIYDLSGNLLNSKKTDSETTNLYISDLKPGIYLVQVYENGKQTTKRFVKS